MSTLHENLLAAIAPLHHPRESPPLRRILEARDRALRAVVELHAPIPCPGFPCLHLDPHNVCKTCGSSGTYVIGEADSTARCSTITAIASALGVDLKEEV